MNHKLPIAQFWARLQWVIEVFQSIRWPKNFLEFQQCSLSSVVVLVIADSRQGRDSAAPIVCACRRACRPIRAQAASLDERLLRKVIKGVGVFSSFVCNLFLGAVHK